MTNLARKILVVDDNEVARTVLLHQLKSLGYEATSVSSGDEAIAELEKAQFDCVLMDCNMPGFSGLEATQLIRSMKSKHFSKITIIAVTGNDEPADRERCLAMGMDDHLPKPCRTEKLESTLYKWLLREDGWTF